MKCLFECLLVYCNNDLSERIDIRVELPVDGKRSSQTFVAYTQLYCPRLAQVKIGRLFLFQPQLFEVL
jgi:hypothetical protein